MGKIPTLTVLPKDNPPVGRFSQSPWSLGPQNNKRKRILLFFLLFQKRVSLPRSFYCKPNIPTLFIYVQGVLEFCSRTNCKQSISHLDGRVHYILRTFLQQTFTLNFYPRDETCSKESYVNHCQTTIFLHLI